LPVNYIKKKQTDADGEFVSVSFELSAALFDAKRLISIMLVRI